MDKHVIENIFEDYKSFITRKDFIKAIDDSVSRFDGFSLNPFEFKLEINSMDGKISTATWLIDPS